MGVVLRAHSVRGEPRIQSNANKQVAALSIRVTRKAILCSNAKVGFYFQLCRFYINSLKGLTLVAQCWKTTVIFKSEELSQVKMFDDNLNTFSVNEAKSTRNMCWPGSHACDILSSLSGMQTWMPGFLYGNRLQVGYKHVLGNMSAPMEGKEFPHTGWQFVFSYCFTEHLKEEQLKNLPPT